MKQKLLKMISKAMKYRKPAEYAEQIIQSQIEVEFGRGVAYEFVSLDGHSHEATDEIVSYGMAEVILYFKNDSEIEKKINNSDLNISIQNYNEIEFDKTLLDCDYDNESQVFTIFAVNNGTNQKEEKTYKVKYTIEDTTDEKIIAEEVFKFKLERGLIEQVYVENLSENITNFMIENNYENLSIKIFDSSDYLLKSHPLTLFGDKLIYMPIIVCAPVADKDFDYDIDFLFDKNENCNLEGKFKILANDYIGIKLNLFSETSCAFKLVAYFKDKKVYNCDFVLKVPTYYENDEKAKITMYSSRARFMKENGFVKFNVFNKQTRIGDKLKYKYKYK